MPSRPRPSGSPSPRFGPPEPVFAAVTVPRFAAQALSFARPELRGRPFAVTEQVAESHKTLIVELSPAAVGEAGARHVFPGLPAFMAARKWPGLPVLPRDPAAEERLREALRAFWPRCTPAFAARGNGGATLDMTGTPATRRAPPEAWAARLRAAVLEAGIDAAAVGVASTQVAARVLARRAAPDGVRVCPPGGEQAALDGLGPEYLPGLSSSARARLKKYGLDTIAAVRALDREALRLRFGLEGDRLHALARGLDFGEGKAFEPAPRATVEAETVLPRDLNDEAALRDQVRLTADKLGHALRRGGLKASRFLLVLAYSDGRTARRTARLDPPTAEFAPLAERAAALFFELYQRRVALRRIRLQVAAPATETGQRDLFEEPGKGRREALTEAIDRIRAKTDFGKVLSGANVFPCPEERPRPKVGRAARERGRHRAARAGQPLPPAPSPSAPTREILDFPQRSPMAGSRNAKPR